MSLYFEAEAGMKYKLGGDRDTILDTVAGAYMAEHPPHPFVFRCWSTESVRQMTDGRFDFNMEKRLPDAAFGQYAFALSRLWSGKARTVEAAVNCFGPVKLLVNGKLVYRSDVAEEVNSQVRKLIEVPLKKGWNSFLLVFRKVASGFGCQFGSSRSHSSPLDFLNPFAERRGRGGWVYSGPVNGEMFSEACMPDADGPEEDSSLRWFPRLQWQEEQLGLLPCARMFGIHPGSSAYAWAKGESSLPGLSRWVIKGMSAGPLRIRVNGELVASLEAEGAFAEEILLPYGQHDWLAESVCGEKDWGFTLEVSAGAEGYPFRQPHPVQVTEEVWFYRESGRGGSELKPEQLQTMYALFSTGSGDGGKTEYTYWRVDNPGTWIRPYLDNTCYGRWSYPVGVTLYGLLRLGRKRERPDMIRYVIRHLQGCAAMYSYSVWDREQYGYPAINTKLAGMHMLDDCGSIGSTMLEANRDVMDEDFLRLADTIAHYMKHVQERREDGAFYRSSPGYYMENTLWADDLYMSTPFLARYFMLTGEQEWLDDAARQFLLFQGYLYLPELQLMSHVYDFKRGMANGIPWGRGNGWVLFSLSELLEILPEDHRDREKLLELFRELCQGALRCQGKNGLWHQVLTDEDSFEETSCTSMFIYAFARGVRFGWLAESAQYAEAVRKAWDGVVSRALEGNGSVHGVCCGSKFSYSPDYYKHDLKAVANDTHGIGIVLLAGVEAGEMDAMLSEGQKVQKVQKAEKVQ